MRTFALLLVVLVVGGAVGFVLWLQGQGSGLEGLGPAPTWPVSFEVPDEPQPEFERVILVTIDTLRADHVSSYGYRRPTTPFLDGLAEKGVLFERAMAAVSHTAPSHATMLTGLPPALHGVLDNGMHLEDDARTAAHLFGAAGYETAAIVNVGFLQAISDGFDTVVHRLLDGEKILASTMQWLERERTSERFFLWVHVYAPHHWKRADWTPRRFLKRLRNASPLAGDELYAYLEELHGLSPQEEGQPFDLGWIVKDMKKGVIEVPDPGKYLELVDAYDAHILHSDSILERLYSTVENLELPGRTLWVVTSDHGEGLASHRIAGHGSRIYQEQLHVPLVLHASDGSLGPRRVSTLVDHADLLPTFAEAAGVRLVGEEGLFDGRSLFPAAGGAAGAKAFAFAQRRPMPPEGEDTAAVFSLQDGRHKYILHQPGPDEFFDLVADPLELENLAEVESPDRERLRIELEGRLRVYLEQGRGGEVDDQYMDELRALGYVDR